MIYANEKRCGSQSQAPWISNAVKTLESSPESITNMSLRHKEGFRIAYSLTLRRSGATWATAADDVTFGVTPAWSILWWFWSHLQLFAFIQINFLSGKHYFSHNHCHLTTLSSVSVSMSEDARIYRTLRFRIAACDDTVFDTCGVRRRSLSLLLRTKRLRGRWEDVERKPPAVQSTKTSFWRFSTQSDHQGHLRVTPTVILPRSAWTVTTEVFLPVTTEDHSLR